VKKFVFILLLILPSIQSFAKDVYVLVNITNNEVITKALVTQIFLGKKTQWAKGERIRMVLPLKSSEDFDEITRKSFEMNKKRFVTYWRKRLFSGSGIPPKYMNNSKSIVAFIKNNTGAIAIVSTEPTESGKLKITKF